MIDHDLIREHCRADYLEDVSEKLLTSYCMAAVRFFEKKTNRKLYKDEIPENAPANALLIEGDVLVALLMLIDNWNDHKGVSTDVALVEVPMGVTRIMDLHRWFFD